MAPIRPLDPRQSERGAALVEFALCLPLLLVVLAGIVDFAFAFQRYEVVANAAREGARMASLPAYDATAVENRVRAYVQQGLSLNSTAMAAVLPAGSITVTYPTLPVTVGGTTENMETALVTVNYNHSFLLLRPILGLINASWGDNITLQAQSQMRSEPGAAGS